MARAFLRRGVRAIAVGERLRTFSTYKGGTDLTLVALCLERHHLRHGAYPADLAKLDPEASAGMATIPPDRVAGSPPHYRRMENGRFFLYYDGWNQKDDGGEVVFQEENPQKIDFKKGDWVWPQLAE